MSTSSHSRFVSNDLAGRDIRIDALRGLMVLGMILVNHPPPGVAVYPPLAHAPWHGWTLADTIFPGFLFVVGMSIRLTMGNAGGLQPPAGARIHAKLLRRFALLAALNFLLINFPYYFLGTLHFTGTLALIGWCYLAVALIHLHSGWRSQLALAGILLAIQWACYAWIPVPGVGAGVLTVQANPAAYIDRLVFVPLFGPQWATFDGLPVVLPMLGSVATTLVGLLAGHWVFGGRAPGAGRLFAGGLGLVVSGAAWDLLLPVNKTLWTGAYVLLMAGIAMQLFAALDAIAQHAASWLKGLQVAGANALFFYVFAQCLQRVLVYGRVHGENGTPIRLRHLLYDRYFAPWMPGEAGSLVFALIFLSVCYLAVLLLYRKRIFLKL